MRRFWNGLGRSLWRGLGPIHRPLARRLDARMNRLLDERLSSELEERLVPTLSAALETTSQTVCRLDDLIAQTGRSTRETDQALQTLLTEVLRLREQVELLHQLVPRPEPEPNGLIIEEPGEPCGSFAAGHAGRE